MAKMLMLASANVVANRAKMPVSAKSSGPSTFNARQLLET